MENQLKVNRAHNFSLGKFVFLQWKNRFFIRTKNTGTLKASSILNHSASPERKQKRFASFFINSSSQKTQRAIHPESQHRFSFYEKKAFVTGLRGHDFNNGFPMKKAVIF